MLSHITHHTSHIIHHTSHITRHTPHVPCHTSLNTYNTPHATTTRPTSSITHPHHTSHLKRHTSHLHPKFNTATVYLRFHAPLQRHAFPHPTDRSAWFRRHRRPRRRPLRLRFDAPPQRRASSHLPVCSVLNGRASSPHGRSVLNLQKTPIHVILICHARVFASSSVTLWHRNSDMQTKASESPSCLYSVFSRDFYIPRIPRSAPFFRQTKPALLNFFFWAIFLFFDHSHTF